MSTPDSTTGSSPGSTPGTTVLGRVGVWTATLDALPVAAAREAVAELDEQGWPDRG